MSKEREGRSEGREGTGPVGQDCWEFGFQFESSGKLLESLVQNRVWVTSGSCSRAQSPCRPALGAWLPQVPTASSLQAGPTSCPARHLLLRRPPLHPLPQPCLPHPSPSQSGPPRRPQSSRGTGEQKGASPWVGLRGRAAFPRGGARVGPGGWGRLEGLLNLPTCSTCLCFLGRRRTQSSGQDGR